MQSGAFDPGAELNQFMSGRTDKGACVSFTGFVRDYAEDDTVNTLELDHYPGYTETEIDRIRQMANTKWPDIDSLIIHRYGKLLAGEPIVQVIVVSPHRKDAFEACTFLMDFLKTQAPFWKKEWRGETSAWIEPTEADYAAQKDWK